jgi:hypothetical protein
MIVNPGLRRFSGNPLQKLFRQAGFYAPLISSLNADIAAGGTSPTFTRADASPCATHTDFEGIVRTVPANCARFQGCRVVRNLLTFTEDFSNAAWVTSFGGTGTTATKTPNFGVAPDGSTTACRVQLNKGAGTTLADLAYIQQAGITANLPSRSVWIKTNDASTKVICLRGNSQLLITATGTWQRVATSDVALSGLFQLILRGTYGTSDSCDLLIWHPQLEDVTGQTNQNPSEYVSVGVLSAPFQGAGVDGILFSPNLNGNTVSSNVVTSGTGAAIKQGVAGVSATAPVDASGPQGYLPEGSRTNVLTYSRDLTNGIWSKVDTTPLLNQVGVDGVPNSATLLTEGTLLTAGTTHGATITANQTWTATVDLKYVNQPWIELIVNEGVGTNNIRAWFNIQTGVKGSTQVTGASTVVGNTITAQANGYYRCTVTGFIDAVSTTANFLVRSATADLSATRVSGAAYIVDMTGLEIGAFASSRIPTVASAVTRNADVLTYPIAGNAADAAGTAYAEVTAMFDTAVNYEIVGFTNAATGRPLYAASIPTNIRIFDGTNVGTSNVIGSYATSPAKVASSWSVAGSTQRICLAGTVPTSGAYDGTICGAGPIGIGCAGDGTVQWNGTIRNVRIWPTALTAAQLQAITT